MNLATGIFLIALAQVIVWFQLNGQFKWDWFANNRLIVAVFLGIPLSIIFVYATDILYHALGKEVWTVRLISFGTGIVVFYSLSSCVLNENLTPKNLTCLILSILIVCIQILWK